MKILNIIKALPYLGLPAYPRSPHCAETERSIDLCPVHLQARGNLFDRHLGIGEQFSRVADLFCRSLNPGEATQRGPATVFQ